MGKIVISENISLDGVIQDPTGEEGFPFGGWFSRMTSQDRQEWTKVEYAEALRAEALLFGRRSYEWFATRWVTRTGDWAERLSELPKYVVSRGLDDLPWKNTTVLTGDALTEVARLRQSVPGDLVVYGSGRLARTLIEHDLVDEVRLTVFPYVLGAGDRLFGTTAEPKPMNLVDARTVGAGLTLLTYAFVAAPGS